METSQQGMSGERSARLVSRVSFEPLSTLAELNGGLVRDGSGLSGDSNGEYEAWRVSRAHPLQSRAPPPPPPAPPPLAAGRCPARFRPLQLGCRAAELSCGSLAAKTHHGRRRCCCRRCRRHRRLSTAALL